MLIMTVGTRSPAPPSPLGCVPDCHFRNDGSRPPLYNHIFCHYCSTATVDLASPIDHTALIDNGVVSPRTVQLSQSSDSRMALTATLISVMPESFGAQTRSPGPRYPGVEPWVAAVHHRTVESHDSHDSLQHDFLFKVLCCRHCSRYGIVLPSLQKCGQHVSKVNCKTSCGAVMTVMTVMS
jgi:hypothetical protein